GFYDLTSTIITTRGHISPWSETPQPLENRTSFAGQNHRHPTNRRPASSVSSGRVTLAPLPVLAIVPLRSIEDRLLRMYSYDSLQTGHQLSTIQIATTKRKLASAQSIKAVFIRKMDFLLWTARGWKRRAILRMGASETWLPKENPGC